MQGPSIEILQRGSPQLSILYTGRKHRGNFRMLNDFTIPFPLYNSYAARPKHARSRFLEIHSRPQYICSNGLQCLPQLSD
jgi:hypothetical protein